VIDKKLIPGLSLLILGIIFFDAAQQKYYLDKFNLTPTNVTVTYLGLLKNHFIRWALWAITCLPYILYLSKKVNDGPAVSGKILKILIAGLITILFSIAFVSLWSTMTNGVNPSVSEFYDSLMFFTFQKGLAFSMATITLSLLVFIYSKEQAIANQKIEITQLRKSNSKLKEALEGDVVPHLNIKIGYKMTPIPVDEIIWIQADDYCVKIHTSEKSFTLRQSMKTLQSELAPFRYIRIHRSALLNLNYIDQINLQASTVKLKNKAEVPFSKNGLKFLKEKLNT